MVSNWQAHTDNCQCTIKKDDNGRIVVVRATVCDASVFELNNLQGCTANVEQRLENLLGVLPAGDHPHMPLPERWPGRRCTPVRSSACCPAGVQGRAVTFVVVIIIATPIYAIPLIILLLLLVSNGSARRLHKEKTR